MNQSLIDRYQPGGDIYERIVAGSGVGAAERVAAAARTGERQRVTDALVGIKYGDPLDESTLSNFYDRITTDPFSAPLDAANRGAGNVISSAIKGIFSNPWVLLIVVAVVLHYLGGTRWLLNRGKAVFAG